MQQLNAFLQGKKTYLLAAAGVLYLFYCQRYGLVPDQSILLALGFGGIATLRHGIETAAAKVLAEAASNGSAPLPPGSANRSGTLPPSAGSAPAGGSQGFARLRLLACLSLLGLVVALLTGCALGSKSAPLPADRITYNSILTIQAGEDAALAAWRVTWNIRWNANEAAKSAPGYLAARAALINEADSVAFKAAAADKAAAALIAVVRTAGALPGDITAAATQAQTAAEDLTSLLTTLKAAK